MKYFRIRLLSILLVTTLMFSGCSSSNDGSADSTLDTSNSTSIGDSGTVNDYDTEELNYSIEDAISISLNEDTISCDSDSVLIDGSTVTIKSQGTYSIGGVLTDGQIIVDCEKTDKVNIILNGVDISCSNTSPIYVVSANKTVLTLADSTQNVVTDNREAKSETDDTSDVPGGAIFSKDDLTINGNGSLTVTGNYNNGIVCKDDLKITGGNITVSALNNAIKGNDSVTIKGGTIDITCDGDGIKTDYDATDEDSEKGYISIEDGTITIKSVGDCLKADTYINIESGTFDLTSNGGYTNATSSNNDFMNGFNGQMGGMEGGFNNGDMGDISMPDGEAFDPSNSDNVPQMPDGETFDPSNSDNVPQMPDGETFDSSNSDSMPQMPDGENSTEDTDSTTELKSKTISADGDLTINGGNFTLNASNDALHTNANIVINDGTFTINAGGKGIHSDYDCTINNGTIDIQNSYEGIEGTNIYVNDGNLNVISSDDGFNASDHTETATGSNGFNVSSNAYLEFNGGTVYVNASGDGLDSNGDIQFNGGTVVVEGPTSSGDGPLDCGDSRNVIVVDGGTLIAGGAVGMFETADSSSTQNVIYSLSVSAKAGDTIVLADEDNNVVCALKSTKNMDGVVFSSESIETGKTYHIYVNPTYDGSFDASGFAEGGTCSDGTDVGSVEVTSTVSQIGTGSAMNGGGFGGGGMGDHGEDHGQDHNPF